MSQKAWATIADQGSSIAKMVFTIVYSADPGATFQGTKGKRKRNKDGSSLISIHSALRDILELSVVRRLGSTLGN